MTHKRRIIKIVVHAMSILAIVALVGIPSYIYFANSPLPLFSKKTDTTSLFLTESYTAIQTNYWEKISDEELSTLYQRAAEKVSGKPQILPKHTKEAVAHMLTAASQAMTPDEKRTFITTVVDAVLVNLKPFGRSRLYTQKQETQLRQNVANVDTSVDLYKNLGVEKTASDAAIVQAYETKSKELATQKTPEAKEELAKVERAKEALATTENRKRYDAGGVEPTMKITFPTPDVAYVNLTKFSPTTPQELAAMLTRGIDPDKQWIILDMRGNVGGAIDMLQVMLGPFIGANVAGYEFYHQGTFMPFRTQTPRVGTLGFSKKIIVLIDGATQSSAELMAAALKKFNVAIVVGTHSKGWGTVENIFPLTSQIDASEKYSLFLVHSITIRDDGEPIEGRGIDPHIDITDANWATKLSTVTSPIVASIVEKIL